MDGLFYFWHNLLLKKMKDLVQLVQSKAQTWLDSPVIDDQTKAEVRSLLAKPDTKELIDNFYKDLEFGTGGLTRHHGCRIQLYE